MATYRDEIAFSTEEIWQDYIWLERWLLLKGRIED